MEPIETSETSAYNNTLTPGTYPKEKNLQAAQSSTIALEDGTDREFRNVGIQ